MKILAALVALIPCAALAQHAPAPSTIDASNLKASGVPLSTTTGLAATALQSVTAGDGTVTVSTSGTTATVRVGTVPALQVSGLAAAASAAAPVQSVAGRTGAVTISLGDVSGTGALAALGVGTGLANSSGNLLVSYGTAAGTAAQGNDGRIIGAVQVANNLSDIASATTARTNLGLGSIATQSAGAVAITGGTIAGTTENAANVTATGSTTARTLATRAADRVNVGDYGAAMNGSTNDIAAFNAARTAAGKWGNIVVPPGYMQLGSNPTSGTGPVLWQMDGNTYNDGATPAVGWQTTGDVIESFLGNSGKYFGRGSTTTASGPVVRIDASVTHTGGTAGNTLTPLQINTSIPAEGSALNTYVWGILSTLTSAATGPGEHVAIVGSSTRTAAGSEIWGADLLSIDTTGLGSATAGAQVGQEIDLDAQGTDTGGAAVNVIPAGSGIRVIQDLIGGAYGLGNNVEIGWGTRLTLGNNADGAGGGHFKRGYSVIAPFTISGFDTSLATEETGAAAVLLAAGQHICFDAVAAHCLSYVSGTTSLGYYVSGSLVFSIDANGNITGKPLLPVTNTYTASGAVAVTDSLAIVNASSTAAMTLASGSTDGHELTVKRWGAGAVTISASIDGSSQSIILQSPAIKETLTLDWSASLATWIMR